MTFMVFCPWLVKIVGLVGGKAAVQTIRPFLSGRILLLYGIIAAAALYAYRRQTVSGLKSELEQFVVAARMGTINSLKIGATVGVIGIIIGVLTYSGLVLTFADIVIELAHGNLILTILLIALASLILGMGVPVTAAYLITAVVAVPALTHLGVNEVAAHMIVYWLSQDSNITPPVCIAAFAGAAIAGANMWRTAFAVVQVRQVPVSGTVHVRVHPGLHPGGHPRGDNHVVRRHCRQCLRILLVSVRYLVRPAQANARRIGSLE